MRIIIETQSSDAVSVITDPPHAGQTTVTGITQANPAQTESAPLDAGAPSESLLAACQELGHGQPGSQQRALAGEDAGGPPDWLIDVIEGGLQRLS